MKQTVLSCNADGVERRNDLSIRDVVAGNHAGIQKPGQGVHQLQPHTVMAPVSYTHLIPSQNGVSTRFMRSSRGRASCTVAQRPSNQGISSNWATLSLPPIS